MFTRRQFSAEKGIYHRSSDRIGARQLIRQAVEAELAALLEHHATEKLEDGRARLVQHGHLPEREALTGQPEVPLHPGGCVSSFPAIWAANTKTAFVLAHELREAMAQEVHTGEKLAGHVEIDGAYFGGHIRPANRKANRKYLGVSRAPWRGERGKAPQTSSLQ